MITDYVDLDAEMKRFVLERAWWCVLRSFDLTQYSPYWDHDKKQAIDGPIWKYNDIIFRGRRVEIMPGNAEDWYQREQNSDIFKVVFYVISSIRPKKEDNILEIVDELKFLENAPRLVKVAEQFRIEHVESKIENKLIFSKCYCTKQTARPDKTLQGMIPVKTYGIKYI
jgi:hypothetical protein